MSRSVVTLPYLPLPSSMHLRSHLTFPAFISLMCKISWMMDKMSPRCFPGSKYPLTLYFTSLGDKIPFFFFFERIKKRHVGKWCGKFHRQQDQTQLRNSSTSICRPSCLQASLWASARHTGIKWTPRFISFMHRSKGIWRAVAFFCFWRVEVCFYFSLGDFWYMLCAKISVR